MKNLLVTGGAGFIGGHLCQLLVENEYKVTAVDNFDPLYSRKIKEENIRKLEEKPNFTFVESDIRETEQIQALLEDQDIGGVIHLAAKAGVRPSLQYPMEYVSVNVDGTVSILEAMRKAEVQQLILGSSSSVYGENTKVPFQEDDPLEQIISVYAASKHSAERFAQMYHNLYDLKVLNLRFFTVYGPAQRPDLAIHKFVKANLSGTPLTIYGDGSMKRDYTFVGDIVEGVHQAIQYLDQQQQVFETFNIGNSNPVSILELVHAIEEVTGYESQLKYLDAPKGDVPVTYADISKARSFLDYEPKTSLPEGLDQFVEWYQNYTKTNETH